LAHRAALACLALAAPAVLLAFCVDAPPLRWAAALAVAVFPVALMTLGAARGGRLDGLRGPFLLLGTVLAAGWLLLLALAGGGPDAVAGLPLGTAVMLFGMVPVPFAIACWAYAAFFDRLGVRQEDLERLRQLRAEAAEGRADRGER
jgi:hypothetical protein